MAVALRIARLHNQLLLPADLEPAGREAAWLRDLSQRSLPTALAGVAERALARAGLPREAVVAVRRLDLRLRLAEGASDDALLRAWSQGLETALVNSLMAVECKGGEIQGEERMPTDAGGSSADANAVAFADVWAAELSHLDRLAQGLEPAWWADRLRDGRGDPLDLHPGAVLARWLERQPARAAAAMAALVDRGGASSLAGWLSEGSAAALALALAKALSQRPTAAAALPAADTPLRALLEQALEQLRRHRGLVALRGEAALPWRLALLLRQQPPLALLPAATLLAVVRELDNPEPQTLSGENKEPARQRDADSPAWPAPDPSGAAAAPAAAPEPPAAGQAHDPLPHRQPTGLSADAAPLSALSPGATSQPEDLPTLRIPARPAGAAAAASGRAEVHAGGLLLLLHRLELRDGSHDWSTAFGDVALLALRRLLQPLGLGERAAALERERPLLVLLCPDRPWPERLERAEPRQPQAAAERLEALIAAIPEGVAFAPGALRQVYGALQGAAPPLPDRAGHALAALLWRPGLLLWDDWQISLRWPHASADAALRRAGWDLDPAWQPALRRVVRFAYGSAAGGEDSTGEVP
ncbi:MAG: hypothetical protein VKK97_02630 [Synechococcaceae cyanobacterium]|nr:hypothetical protein [Synechococcaceae cyanobacterium]